MKPLIQSFTLENGIHCKKIFIETALRRGIPGFQIGGISQNHSREIAERIKTAFQSNGIDLPYKSIFTNLSPAGIKKSGSHYDLGIAVSLLFQINSDIQSSFINKMNLNKTVFLGELSLMGDILPVDNVQTFIQNALQNKIENIILPEENLSDVVSILPINLYTVKNIKDIFQSEVKKNSGGLLLNSGFTGIEEFNSFRFPPHVLRAMMIAAAGWHSAIFIGPPGTGKTTAAKLLRLLLPEPSFAELLEIYNIHYHPGKNKNTIERPVRMPHHTATPRSMVGGGYPVEFGEVTKAHNGLLILDEMAEFHRSSLQCLREPMQEKEVHITRGTESISFPANFLFIATSNPCSCGYLGSSVRACICKPASVESYRKKIMGPLRDRIELEVIVDGQRGERDISFREIKESIHRAVEMQKKRFRNYRYTFNSEIEENDLVRLCSLDHIQEAETLFSSTRYSHRVISGITRIARTIADLSGEEKINRKSLLEAFSFRTLDEYWPLDHSHLIKK